MLRYVVAKLLLAVPLLLGASLAVFALGSLAPGDPVAILLGDGASPEEVARLRESLGLDLPWFQQYLRFVGQALQGDLGVSYRSKLPVGREIAGRLPATIELAAAALLFGGAVGFGAGLLAAARRGTALDRAAILLATVGASVPVFWTGLLLISLFSLTVGWLPASGRGTPAHLLMPTLALGSVAAAQIARVTRASVLEAIGQDYVRTARAKGLGEAAVLRRHALRTALIPVATVVGLQVGALLGGAVLTETVFAWPGIGRLTVQAIEQRDYPVVRGTVLLAATIVTLTNLVLDILIVYLDPRIRYR